MERTWVRWAGWAVVVLAGVFFIGNGVQKLLGTDQMVVMFQELGLPGWMRIAVGIAETLGGLSLLVPRVTAAAAAFLGCLMAGAVVVELLNGHAFGALIPAQWLVLFALIVWVRRRRLAKQRPEPAPPAS